MAQKLVNKALGLKTYKNELSQPDGTLIKADNIIIDRDNVIEPRRGFKRYGDFGVSDDRAKQILQYKNRLLVHYDDKLLYDDGNGTFSAFEGTYDELIPGLRIKGSERNGNFYFTTAAGVKKISATSASDFTTSANFIYDSGAAKGLDGEGLPDYSTSGFFDTQSVIAYRIVWGYKDANEALVLGAPSSRILVRNIDSASAAIVALEFTIPEEVSNDAKYFYQIYRSEIQDDSLNPGTAVPSDELQLVFEDFPVANDFINGYVSTIDITPEDFRNGGTYLYTNPVSGDSILQSNEKPPVCQDISEYRNSVFYANTKTRHQKQVAMLSTSLLTNGDTFVISVGSVTSVDTVFTFMSTESVSSQHVYLATGGTVSQNIDDTARSLVKVINRNLGPVYAYYISGVDDVPGQILLEARELEDIPFYIKVGATTSGVAFNPRLPKGNTESSTDQESKNRVYFSKTGEPEAVPAVNYVDVGAKDAPIVRIAALRNSLLIFKTDGIYRISGTDTKNFTLNLEDSSALITAADSLSILNNEIYVATTQGIVIVTEAGGNPRVISREIESDILQPKSFAAFSTATFGVSYESDRSYLLFMPTVSADTTATQVYRYNVFTQTWVRWTLSKTCGLVLNNDDKLYLGTTDINFIEQERKSFDRTDYSDRQYSSSILWADVEGLNLQLANLTNVNLYDAIVQETYITISRFNRVLTKLDNDPGLPSNDYAALLTMGNGDAMNNALVALVTKIKIDDPVGSYSTPTGSDIFAVLRDEFNNLMEELNAAEAVFYTNYRSYTDLVTYESIISKKTTTTNVVELFTAIPIIQGVVTIYSSVPVKIEWSPESVGDVSLMKHFRDSTLMFDQFNFATGEFSFRSDISDNTEKLIFYGEGTGSYGSQVYGEYTYGGLANQVPHRTYIPRNKQRCRFLILGYQHNGSREKFAITGYSVTFNNSATERAYKS